jgi:hypothetical protein
VKLRKPDPDLDDEQDGFERLTAIFLLLSGFFEAVRF